MGRKKKNSTPTPDPNPPQNENTDSVSSRNENEILIEDHVTASANLESDSAWEKIKSAATRSGLLIDDEETRVETRGRKKKTAASDEFATLLISVMVLILSFSSIPEDVKPNDSELRVLANHLSSLMLRHLPISSKFSQDSLDVIGIMAVLSGWYARVSPAIKRLQEKNKPEKDSPGARVVSGNNPAPAQTSKQGDPIERLSPSTARFLDEVEKRNHDNANS